MEEAVCGGCSKRENNLIEVDMMLVNIFLSSLPERRERRVRKCRPGFGCTVKTVCNGHPWDSKKVAVVQNVVVINRVLL